MRGLESAGEAGLEAVGAAAAVAAAAVVAGAAAAAAAWAGGGGRSAAAAAGHGLMTGGRGRGFTTRVGQILRNWRGFTYV